jgi:hypothetical protein
VLWKLIRGVDCPRVMCFLIKKSILNLFQNHNTESQSLLHACGDDAMELPVVLNLIRVGNYLVLLHLVTGVFLFSFTVITAVQVAHLM